MARASRAGSPREQMRAAPGLRGRLALHACCGAGLRRALGLCGGAVHGGLFFFQRMPLGLPICVACSQGRQGQGLRPGPGGGCRPRRALTELMVAAAVSLFGGRIWTSGTRVPATRGCGAIQGFHMGSPHDGESLRGGAPL